MYKYFSKNELGTFAFHDAEIINANISNGCLIIELQYLNVLVENPNNNYQTAMQIDKTQITFKKFEFIELVKIHPLINGVSKREKVILGNMEILNLLSNCTIMDYSGENDKAASFDFLSKKPCDLFDITVRYSEVAVQWNAMIKKAFFVRD